MKKTIRIYLIKPSSYDDDGYVVRYLRGVLPSNTLACLAALTKRAATSKNLTSFQFEVRVIDESVMKVDLDRVRRARREVDQVIVCLVGVQTHQYPRASDLAKAFRSEGLTVMIGGFHVTGQMAMLDGIPSEVQELLDLGICVVLGEIEEEWSALLEDAVSGQLQSIYDFTNAKPDLRQAPIPLLESRLMKRFVLSHYATIDCGRGCPFDCSFCTIINVQGRKMRFRSAEKIAAAIRENYLDSGADFYFFTDDNFARNKNWEKIFDVLIQLRESEGIPVQFMMQVDVLSHRIKGFVEKAARAGCSNVFIGMESINEDNLKAAGKRQNKVEDYSNLIEAYRQADIATHVGYILGFPFDTRESIREDLEQLMNDVQVDMVSFFILTPLPGSRDHLEMHQQGLYMDPDYNKYDSQHETMHFANFPETGSLLRTYQEAWATFYSFENLQKVLKRAPKRCYWNLFQNFLWYKSAALIDQRHPMMTGFLRLKGRNNVRPGVVPLPRRVYYFRRVKELYQWILASLQLIVEMQFLWLETRHRLPAEQRVLDELRQLRSGQSLKSGLAEIQAAYARTRLALPEIRVPSRFRLLVRKWNPFAAYIHFYSIDDVLSFWNKSLENLKRGRIRQIPPTATMSRLLQDLPVAFHFISAWIRQSGTSERRA